ncbi:MAG: hypothetical protein KDC26_00505 [Armatimonadetes bacterium]|nr:hypothetical protein [Armatimonadota bacterium]
MPETFPLRVAIVTTCELPEPDVDEELILAGFQMAGVHVEMAAWDDPQVDWESFDVAVIRSTWDYPWRIDKFLDWLDYVETKTLLLNPASVVKPNLHKSYLRALEQKGIPIVPTEFLSADLLKDSAIDLGELMSKRSWEKVVLKPAIGAGSYLTRVFSIEQIGAATKFLENDLKGHDVLVQKFISTVSEGGERSIIVIDGVCTHKIVKSPRFADDEESVSDAVSPDPEEVAFSHRVLDAAGFAEPLLYARVDLMRDETGQLLLSELELAEPSLFFKQNPLALTKLVEGTISRARK